MGKKNEPEKVEVKEIKIEESSDSCESILRSIKYSNIEKDLLRVTLDPNRNYTLEQVEKILEKELRRMVK